MVVLNGFFWDDLMSETDLDGESEEGEKEERERKEGRGRGREVEVEVEKKKTSGSTALSMLLFSSHLGPRSSRHVRAGRSAVRDPSHRRE